MTLKQYISIGADYFDICRKCGGHLWFSLLLACLWSMLCNTDHNMQYANVVDVY